MPAKKITPKEDTPDADCDLIKTVSEVENLSAEEKEAFRLAGGTTIFDK